ncbi:amidophosphoribosyltransferase [Hippea alviniae]|uniref:amidophosphoribosyltransferase n=1 Tax=Hippea alviniae TaxID=1279027 RepID=UPI0003B46477|nr:amidophosphoribosyltransferase [Hippea alviniae]
MCGIVGIFNKSEAANYVYLGLHALQHRGQEAAGIVSTDGDTFYVHKGKGLVNEIFNKKGVISSLKGRIAIGHNRYSTFGDESIANVQPLNAHFDLGDIAIAHNGNLVNANGIKRRLVSEGAIFNSNSDTEVIIHLIARSSKTSFFERLVEALSMIKGAFSLVIMREDELYAVRDPWGFRPLVMGKLDDAVIFASETCAFDLIGAEYIRDVEPGEIVVANRDGIHSYRPFEKQKEHKCVFEYIYFARPDSLLWNRYVYSIRKKMGEVLAIESPVDADIVIPTPDSGVPAALGFAKQSGLEFDFGLIRNHYVGRTFIEPAQSIRNFGVRLKLNPAKDVLDGKRVVVVDDSIVRGTTSRRIVKMIRNAGAKEVHLRIASPPVISPCFYGIDTPTKKELIASSHTIEEIRKYSTADSVAYLSLEGLKSIMGEEGFCFACFSGDYPIEFER